MGADDAYLLRSQLWTADGRTLLRSRPTPPLSAYGAYGRVATAVPRPAAAAEARRDLPVVQSEADVMDAIAGADVVVLCGATGSGKTSQLPQMLWEAGYGAAPIRAPRDVSATTPGGAPSSDAAAPPPPPPVWLGIPGMIGVTQPRRVAATAMARRVAAEMGVPCGPGGRSGATPNVGYQVRYDASHVDQRTRIKFMTDGILLRELQVRMGCVCVGGSFAHRTTPSSSPRRQADVLLRSYSVIVVDEAHERSVNTDLLVGLLSRTVALRNGLAREEADAARAAAAAGARLSASMLPLAPLKLIIMSATLRVADFAGNRTLFAAPPPVVNVDARQWPVNVHFARETCLGDYVGAAVEKAAKVHTRLPDGGILIFVTGQAEVEDAVRRLRARFPGVGAGAGAAALTSKEDSEDETDGSDEDAGSTSASDGRPAGDASTPVMADAPSADTSPPDQDSLASGPKPVHVLPLFALLPWAAQQRVFLPPPAGAPHIVVATNVAETSLTIPGIR